MMELRAKKASKAVRVCLVAALIAILTVGVAHLWVQLDESAWPGATALPSVGTGSFYAMGLAVPLLRGHKVARWVLLVFALVGIAMALVALVQDGLHGLVVIDMCAWTSVALILMVGPGVGGYFASPGVVGVDADPA